MAIDGTRRSVVGDEICRRADRRGVCFRSKIARLPELLGKGEPQQG